MFLLTLRAARVNRNMSVEEASENLGISADTLYKYETGLTSPNIQTALAMAELYNTPIDMLDFGVNTSSEKPNR